MNGVCSTVCDYILSLTDEDFDALFDLYEAVSENGQHSNRYEKGRKVLDSLGERKPKEFAKGY